MLDVEVYKDPGDYLEENPGRGRKLDFPSVRNRRIENYLEENPGRGRKRVFSKMYSSASSDYWERNPERGRKDGIHTRKEGINELFICNRKQCRNWYRR